METADKLLKLLEEHCDCRLDTDDGIRPSNFDILIKDIESLYQSQLSVSDEEIKLKITEFALSDLERFTNYKPEDLEYLVFKILNYFKSQLTKQPSKERQISELKKNQIIINLSYPKFHREENGHEWYEYKQIVAELQGDDYYQIGEFNSQDAPQESNIKSMLSVSPEFCPICSPDTWGDNKVQVLPDIQVCGSCGHKHKYNIKSQEREQIKHCCGEQGFGMSTNDRCPACENEKSKTTKT